MYVLCMSLTVIVLGKEKRKTGDVLQLPKLFPISQ